MNKHIYSLFLFLVCILPPAAGEETQKTAGCFQQICEEVAEDPVFRESLISICVRNGKGETLADVNAERMMVPASNVKLISTGAALHYLGPDFRFKTALCHDGNIVDGVLKGNLYIKGGADPTLGSKDSIATPIETVFRQWEELIRRAGIKKIEGNVIGDGRWAEGMAEEPTWLWNDIGTYYGTGVTGLMFYENMQSFLVTPGAQTGADINIRPYYPDCPWMEFRYACSTGINGSGDRLYMYTSDLAPIAEIRGTFAIDRGKKRVDCSNKFPEYTCAYYFYKYLKSKGIQCTGEAADSRFRPCVLSPETGLAEIGATWSPTLDRIVYQTNHASNNLYAETLLRTLGKQMRNSSCYDSSRVALLDILKSLNIKTSSGLKIQDGSGLSRQNYVSADFFCRFLDAMMASGSFEAYAESLPSPGFEGSLQYNMKSYPASLRERIKVKSGSMNGVRCYSGYIIPEDGARDEVIIFSILTGNCTSENWKVRPLLDKLMATLAR